MFIHPDVLEHVWNQKVECDDRTVKELLNLDDDH